MTNEEQKFLNDEEQKLLKAVEHLIKVAKIEGTSNIRSCAAIDASKLAWIIYATIDSRVKFNPQLLTNKFEDIPVKLDDIVKYALEAERANRLLSEAVSKISAEIKRLVEENTNP